MHYGKKHDLPFGIMDVAGLLRLNIRRRAPGQVYVDCPICGDRRGKMNLNTAKDLWRCNYCGEGGGMLSLYAKVYGVSNSDAYREICDALAVNGFSPDYTVPEKTTPAEAEQSDAASVQEVHQTLSMLLSMLTLIPAHRAHLQFVRGLSDDEITRFGFKSTPPPFLCRSLTNRLVKAGCRVQGVPGFYVDDNGCWTVKFHQRTSGIIIPIFGVDGLIHGAQIRLDHPLKDKDDPPEKTGVKYLTLSSTGKRMGTTSGSPIHFVGDPCSRVVYVTEGCLKADVAHALMHRTFVATLGVNNTAKLDELFAFLHRNGTEEIIEAEDMDKYSNEMVEKGASKIYALAVRHGMRCRRLTWNPNYKGIDDWQLALRRKEQKMKEDPGMTFKEQYLNGLCGLEMLETCTEKWHAMKVDSISLRDYRDLALYGKDDLEFTRYYESVHADENYGLGGGWTSNFSYALEFDGRSVIAHLPRAVTLYFPIGFDGSFDTCGDYSLAQTGSGYAMTDKAGTIYRFDNSGRILSIVYLSGNTLSFQYDGDKLRSVSNGAGSFTFS